jgi:hypothetical protein
MSCCGRSRQQLSFLAAAQDTARRPPPVERRFEVLFEYTGATALTAVGPVTGRRYRFEGRGARVAVDPRDRQALARVPGLRQAG